MAPITQAKHFLVILNKNMFNIHEVLNVFTISIAARLFFSSKKKNCAEKPRKKIPAQQMDGKKIRVS